jgi:hypothetical protein
MDEEHFLSTTPQPPLQPAPPASMDPTIHTTGIPQVEHCMAKKRFMLVEFQAKTTPQKWTPEKTQRKKKDLRPTRFERITFRWLG